MFGQRKRLHRFALLALLAWAFALASSVVNACVITVVPAGVQSHDHSAPAHGPASPHAEQTPCEKFCDAESSVSLTAAQKGSAWSTFAPALPPSEVTIVQVVPDRRGAAPAETAPRVARVPIPIAFLRLAL